jgi:hypothetical protein
MEALSTMRSSPAYVSGPGIGRNGEGHVFLFTSGNVFSHCVGDFLTCVDFNSSIANLFVNETLGGHILFSISD